MSIKEKHKEIFAQLKDQFGLSNTMEAPKIEKVVVSTGTGSIADKDKLALIEDRLQKITGQKASPRGARKSIASFKIREGDVVGYQVTLRGSRMYDFLDKLVNIALPRTKDFQGLKKTIVDEVGNCTIGLPEHTAFLETSDEEIKNVFGLSITIVTSASDRAQALALFRALGLPFKTEN